MPLLKTLVLGFISGFLATLIFHQGLWYVLYQIQLLVNGAWGFGAALFLGARSRRHGRRCLRSVTAKAPAQLTAGSVSPQTLVRGNLSEATTGTFEAVGFAFIADAGDMCRLS